MISGRVFYHLNPPKSNVRAERDSGDMIEDEFFKDDPHNCSYYYYYYYHQSNIYPTTIGSGGSTQSTGHWNNKNSSVFSALFKKGFNYFSSDSYEDKIIKIYVKRLRQGINILCIVCDCNINNNNKDNRRFAEEFTPFYFKSNHNTGRKTRQIGNFTKYWETISGLLLLLLFLLLKYRFVELCVLFRFYLALENKRNYLPSLKSDYYLKKYELEESHHYQKRNSLTVDEKKAKRLSIRFLRRLGCEELARGLRSLRFYCCGPLEPPSLHAELGPE